MEGFFFAVGMNQDQVPITQDDPEVGLPWIPGAVMPYESFPFGGKAGIFWVGIPFPDVVCRSMDEPGDRVLISFRMGENQRKAVKI